MKSVTPQTVLAIAEMAKDWPTVTEAAQRYGVPVRSLNRAIQHHQVIAFKTNVNRVEPASFAAWLVSRQQ
jgi:hypothetical protein